MTTTPNGLAVGDLVTVHPIPFEGMECPKCGIATSMVEDSRLKGIIGEVIGEEKGTYCVPCKNVGVSTTMRYNTLLVLFDSIGGAGGIPWTWLRKVIEEKDEDTLP